MIRFSVFSLFAILFISSCSKNNIINPPEPEPVDTVADTVVVDTTKPPVIPKDRFVTKPTSTELGYFYVDGDVNTDLFIGSLWNLKDTSSGLVIETMKTFSEPFRNTVYLPDFIMIPEESMIPSYDRVKSYLTRSLTGKSSSSASGHFNSSDFTDYGVVKKWLGNSKDVKRITDFVVHADSTSIRKKSAVLLDAEVLDYTVFLDHAESMENTPKDKVAQWKSQGMDPHYVSIVAYGHQVFFMGESDSSSTDLQAALRKLLAEEELSVLNKAVLADGSLLVYYRSDVKDAYIQYANGLVAIEKLVTDFQQVFKNKKPTYDYPLHYYLSNLTDFNTLRYTFNFNLWVEQQ